MNSDLFPTTWYGWSGSTPPNPLTPQGWSHRVNMSDLTHGANAMLLGEIPLDFNIMDNPYGQANGGAWGYVLPYAGPQGINYQLVTNEIGRAHV